MLLKVISTKTVFGDKEKILETVMKDKASAHLLYRVFGEISGYEIGKGRHQRIDKETKQAVDTFWTRFSGDFRAVDLNGEIFEASTAFLPDYVSGQFVTELKEEGGTTIAFAYDVFARYNTAAATSYEFIATPVKKQGEEDRVAAMMLALPPMPKGTPLLTGPANAGTKGK